MNRPSSGCLTRYQRATVWRQQGKTCATNQQLIMTFTTLDQVKLWRNVATVPVDSQGRQFFAFGTGAPQRAMTEQELISWANGNYHIR